ncbi:hypothetical protein A4S06_11670 [Erysipelotrichaceae bacterium MTC7]|nr:hypothetical protein A4S06_11670 [Erysipelotrichaceae bacterium MTC7]
MINQVMIVGILANKIELKYNEENEPYTVISVITRCEAKGPDEVEVINYTLTSPRAPRLVEQHRDEKDTTVILRGCLIQKGATQEFIINELLFMKNTGKYN